MARGRFISNEIIVDRQVNELSTDTCRLAYTYLITLADCEGRVIGEPDMLLSLLFPRRRDLSPDKMEDWIQEWVDAGFVVWYEGTDGDRVLQLVNFDKHQVGLRKGREAKSKFAGPEECRIISGVIPEKVPVNIKENNNSNNNLISNKNTNNESSQKFNSLYNECKKIYEEKKGGRVEDDEKYSSMIDDFVLHNVTATHYEAAIDAMDNNSNYSATKPTSYGTWAKNIANKQIKSRKLNKEERQNGVICPHSPDDYRKSWVNTE